MSRYALPPLRDLADTHVGQAGARPEVRFSVLIEFARVDLLGHDPRLVVAHTPPARQQDRQVGLLHHEGDRPDLLRLAGPHDIHHGVLVVLPHDRNFRRVVRTEHAHRFMRLLAGHVDAHGLCVSPQAGALAFLVQRTTAEPEAGTEHRRLRDAALVLGDLVVGLPHPDLTEVLIDILAVTKDLQDALAAGYVADHDGLDGREIAHHELLVLLRREGAADRADDDLHRLRRKEVEQIVVTRPNDVGREFEAVFFLDDLRCAGEVLCLHRATRPSVRAAGPGELVEPAKAVALAIPLHDGGVLRGAEPNRPLPDLERLYEFVR